VPSSSEQPTGTDTPFAWVQLGQSAFLLPAVAFAGIAACAAAALSFGFATGLLAATAAMLILAVWFLWSSLQMLATDPVQDLVSPRVAEVEQKASMLRVLDDLEYEKAVGRISDDDYREQRDRVREQAREALQASDPRMLQARKRAEALLAAALREEHLPPADALNSASHSTDGEPDAKRDTAEPSHQEVELQGNIAPGRTNHDPRHDKRARLACAHCDTSNEPDARFCKTCGRELTVPAAPTKDTP
jgi:hypothetical protein